MTDSSSSPRPAQPTPAAQPNRPTEPAPASPTATPAPASAASPTPPPTGFASPSVAPSTAAPVAPPVAARPLFTPLHDGPADAAPDGLAFPSAAPASSVSSAGAPAPAPSASPAPSSAFAESGGSARRDARAPRGDAPERTDVDPFVSSPRVSSTVMCAAFGLVLLALAALTWWLAVRTTTGQQFDDMVLGSFAAVMPSWMGAATVFGLPLGASWLMVGVALAVGIAGLAVALVRRRWWLAGQIVAFAAVAYAAAKLLKELLPREALVRTAVTESGVPAGNTSPSGHAALTIAAGLVLLCAVPRAARAVTALVTGAWSVLVSSLLIAHGWHRPSDIVVAYLLVAGIAMIGLAFTRASGMDRPGARAGSSSVQAVGSVLLTAGSVGVLYTAYVLWQLVPGLDMGAEWAASPACAAALVGIASAAALSFGLVLAMRQLTASPLSRLGLVGAPPAPPASPSSSASRG